MIKEAIEKIVMKGDLTFDEAYTVMREIMSGETTATQNAAFLAAPEPAEQCSVSVDLRRYFRCGAHTDALLTEAMAHTEEAVRLLAGAKAAHDELEALYRPHVAFEGLDLLTREYRKNLKAELLRA